MSGGFFRGTSADQDTRFSNKQAKLLKSQKFALELEHLVDMTKVKMDIMKPWIATRVTELLGFEDEVLINFIFGLLEGKEVNGKEIQISLTGFMEKNTGKFMKELWSLLLSAQQNSSGVPQQFLDAKEEETRKKKEEADRIADEIRKKREKESRGMDQERVRKMDGGLEKKTANPMELSPRASNGHPNEKRDDERRATRERLRSRSLSKSPRARSDSVSSDKLYQSPRRRSPATRRRYSPRRSRSPPRRGSYYRRSRSPLRRRSPSPARRRLQSPRCRSRSPGHRRHRRTPSPGRRRGTPSPTRRRRTPSPVRRRRTPSPVRRRRTPSPVRRRRTPSPVRQRRTPSPVRQRRTPSPVMPPSSLRKRSSSPIHRRSPSPVRKRLGSPLHRKSLSPVLDELPLPSRRVSSPSSRRKERSPSTSLERSPILARGRSPVQATRSPLRVRKRSETPSEKSLSLKSSSCSPASRGSLSPYLRRSLQKKSPGASSKEKTRERSFSPYKNHKKQDRRHSEDKRAISPSESPVQRVKDRMRRDDSPSHEKPGNRRPRHDSPGRLEESNNGRQKRSENSSSLGKQRDSPRKMENKDAFPTAKAVGHGLSDVRNNDQERERGKSAGTGAYSENADGVKSQNIYEDSPTKKRRSDRSGSAKSDDQSLQLSNSAKEDSRLRSQIMEEQAGVPNAVSDGSDDDGHGHKEKRRNKRSKRHDTDSGDESNDSEAGDRKEAKRRRRAERKLRKEEKRRRREERRRKREERHSEKHKSKRGDSSSPSDKGAHQRNVDPSDSPRAKGREIHPVVQDERDAKEKKLEVELRLKALESFKAAKKGSGH